jgi:hypothetical protein
VASDEAATPLAKRSDGGRRPPCLGLARLKSPPLPMVQPFIFQVLLHHYPKHLPNPLNFAIATFRLSIGLELPGRLSNKHKPGFTTHYGSQPSGRESHGSHYSRIFLLLILSGSTIYLWIGSTLRIYQRQLSQLQVLPFPYYLQFSAF